MSRINLDDASVAVAPSVSGWKEIPLAQLQAIVQQNQEAFRNRLDADFRLVPLTGAAAEHESSALDCVLGEKWKNHRALRKFIIEGLFRGTAAFGGECFKQEEDGQSGDVPVSEIIRAIQLVQTKLFERKTDEECEQFRNDDLKRIAKLASKVGDLLLLQQEPLILTKMSIKDSRWLCQSQQADCSDGFSAADAVNFWMQGSDEVKISATSKFKFLFQASQASSLRTSVAMPIFEKSWRIKLELCYNKKKAENLQPVISVDNPEIELLLTNKVFPKTLSADLIEGLYVKKQTYIATYVESNIRVLNIDLGQVNLRTSSLTQACDFLVPSPRKEAAATKMYALLAIENTKKNVEILATAQTHAVRFKQQLDKDMPSFLQSDMLQNAASAFEAIIPFLLTRKASVVGDLTELLRNLEESEWSFLEALAGKVNLDRYEESTSDSQIVRLTPGTRREFSVAVLKMFQADEQTWVSQGQVNERHPFVDGFLSKLANVSEDEPSSTANIQKIIQAVSAVSKLFQLETKLIPMTSAARNAQYEMVLDVRLGLIEYLKEKKHIEDVKFFVVDGAKSYEEDLTRNQRTDRKVYMAMSALKTCNAMLSLGENIKHEDLDETIQLLKKIQGVNANTIGRTKNLAKCFSCLNTVPLQNTGSKKVKLNLAFATALKGQMKNMRQYSTWRPWESGSIEETKEIFEFVEPTLNSLVSGLMSSSCQTELNDRKLAVIEYLKLYKKSNRREIGCVLGRTVKIMAEFLGKKNELDAIEDGVDFKKGLRDFCRAVHLKGKTPSNARLARHYQDLNELFFEFFIGYRKQRLDNIERNKIKNSAVSETFNKAADESLAQQSLMSPTRPAVESVAVATPAVVGPEEMEKALLELRKTVAKVAKGQAMDDDSSSMATKIVKVGAFGAAGPNNAELPGNVGDSSLVNNETGSTEKAAARVLVF